MKIDALTGAYLAKAQVRFRALKFYYDEGAYSDVVREAQENGRTPFASGFTYHRC